MALSPTGVIPELLMYPNRLGDVMTLIKALPAPGDYKVDLLIGWCRTVGVKVNASQRETIRSSGWDYQGAPVDSAT